MNKFITLFAITMLFFTAWQAAADQFVHGYYRRNETYVAPYHRSPPDQTVTNNYSYKGNSNPHTGSIGSNYYRHDATSLYYTGPNSHGNVGHANQLGYQYLLHRQSPPGSSLCKPPYRMTAQDGCQR
jgi:hypothetical protein